MHEVSSGAAARTRRVVFLTGMSGAGISTALKTLEDLGYEAVDNLPQGMIGALIKNREKSGKPLAISIDSRNADFNAADLLAQCAHWKAAADFHASLLFLDCTDETLLRRFSETRRRHPLAIDRPVVDGIQRERVLMQSLFDHADHVIDTSMLSLHELRRLIDGYYHTGATEGLRIFVTSFAFRHGLPREADLVFDARFLLNPHWEENLRPKTGRSREVADYIADDPHYGTFIKNLLNLITPLLPRFAREGKSYLTIAIGCTGGRHRSVLVAETLATALAAQGYIVGIAHRDMERTGRDGVQQDLDQRQNRSTEAMS